MLPPPVVVAPPPLVVALAVELVDAPPLGVLPLPVLPLPVLPAPLSPPPLPPLEPLEPPLQLPPPPPLLVPLVDPVPAPPDPQLHMLAALMAMIVWFKCWMTADCTLIVLFWSPMTFCMAWASVGEALRRGGVVLLLGGIQAVKLRPQRWQ